jgi:anaerobic magnesium-protoporphyrin IX monomethyl ester cyclase
MNQQKKIIITNMPSSTSMYSESKIKVVVKPRPYVSIATLAACCIEKGIKVKCLDLDSSTNPGKTMTDVLNEYKPDYICFSFSTPLFNECCEFAKFIREKHKDVILVAGGVHGSIYPKEVLQKSVIDIVVMGEGDFVLPEIVLSQDLSKVRGIGYKKDGEIKINPRQPPLESLDILPMPAWHLFDIEKYQMPRLITRRNPVGTIETSRGCLAGCSYCNKSIFGRKWRCKSAKRTVDEFEYMLKCGFKEIHVYDDMFTTDLDRAKEICDLIIERKLDLSWRLDCGLRIDSVDKEFFEKLKKSGCYCIGFGLESGSQKILDDIDKGAKPETAKYAVRWAKEAGLETVGFFMFGLPKETIETMEESIKYACSLDLDYAKVTLATPYPGTKFFLQMQKNGKIHSKDWSAYNFHSPSKVWNHPNLDWETLDKYYKKFYTKFYFRPTYLYKRFIRGVKRGDLFYDLYYAVKTFL